MINKIDVIEVLAKVFVEILTFAVIFCVVAVFGTVIGTLAHGDVKIVSLALLVVIYFCSDLIVDFGK